MARYFSASRGGFFDEAIHGLKGKKGSLIPKDAVEVSDADHAALMAEVASGKRVAAAADGTPEAVDGGRTPEEVLLDLRRKRDRELAATDWTQLGDVGLTEEQRRAYAAHRQALRDYPAQVEAAVEAGLPPESIEYPQAPALERPRSPQLDTALE